MPIALLIFANGKQKNELGGDSLSIERLYAPPPYTNTTPVKTENPMCHLH